MIAFPVLQQQSCDGAASEVGELVAIGAPPSCGLRTRRSAVRRRPRTADLLVRIDAPGSYLATLHPIITAPEKFPCIHEKPGLTWAKRIVQDRSSQRRTG